MILFLNCHAFTFCIFSCMFDNFLKLTYLSVCKGVLRNENSTSELQIESLKFLSFKDTWHFDIIMESKSVWSRTCFFYSQGNSQPSNLYPHFWKLRSWEIKVFFKPEKNFRFCKPDFFFRSSPWKKAGFIL